MCVGTTKQKTKKTTKLGPKQAWNGSRLGNSIITVKKLVYIITVQCVLAVSIKILWGRTKELIKM